MSLAGEQAAGGRRGVQLFVLGALLWLAAQAVTWPVALSFGDEIGYVGQVRALFAGHVRPLPADPGVWLPGEHGLVARYPLFLPLLVAPLYALGPRVMFASGVAAALALAVIAAGLLRSWGRNPVWALLLLAHPTVVIIARTVMVDLLLATFSVGAWYALTRDRRALAALLLALVVVAKPTGVLIAGALLVGEAVRLFRASPRSPDATTRLGWAAAGIAAGGGLTAALNIVSTGTPGYGYARFDFGGPPFAPAHIPHTLPIHLAGLALCPPLLGLGIVALWRRRALAPLAASIGLVGAMGCYLFVDTGRNFAETLTLAPRLILPAVAMLMIGYADLTAGAVERLGRSGRWVVVVVPLVPALVCLGLASRHRAWQDLPAAALAAARQEVARLGGHELGLSGGALKVGMLFPGRTVGLVPGSAAPEVVLCCEDSASRRMPGLSFRCDMPGYDDHRLAGGFHLLVRGDARPR
jgi:hypothetical protein